MWTKNLKSVTTYETHWQKMSWQKGIQFGNATLSILLVLEMTGTLAVLGQFSLV